MFSAFTLKSLLVLTVTFSSGERGGLVKVKILYYGMSPFVPSGYGRTTRELVFRLRKFFEIDINAYYGFTHSVINLNTPYGSIKLIGNSVGNSYWDPSLPLTAKNYDIVLTHMDQWIIYNYLMEISKPMVHWLVHDHEPLSPVLIALLSSANVAKVVPMTNWSRKVILRDCGLIDREKVAEPIPLGVDVEKFNPSFRRKASKEELVKALGFNCECEFMVGTVAVNYSIRELIPTMMEAFAIFTKETKAKACYYIHATPKRLNPESYDLALIKDTICDKYGLNWERIRFKAKDLTDEELAQVYNTMDVHLLTIMGGSFEMPIIEAGACETPTITTDFSAMPEIVGYGERGLVVKPSAYLWVQALSSKYAMVNAKDVAEALRIYYEDEKLRKHHGRKMREWVLKNCTWDIVAEKWVKLLLDVEEYLKTAGKPKVKIYGL